MKRDLRLDTFRGLFLAWMALNHLGGPLHAYLFQSLGFISSAEPFVFISGFTAGMVYGRFALQKGFSALIKRAWRRALDIYGFHIAIFLFVLILEFTISNRDYQSLFQLMNPLPKESPVMATALAAAFLLQPGFMDILPMYCLFMLLTPFAVQGFKSRYGRWWVLGISLVVWALATYSFWDGLDRYGKQFLPVNLGFFNPLAWQFLFVTGLYFGFRRTAGQPLTFKKPWILLSLVIWVGLLLIRYQVLSPNRLGFDIETVTIRESFGPLRVLNFAVLAYLVAGLASRFPRAFQWPFFSYLGQHSLQVFSFHVVMLYLTRPLYGIMIPYGWPAVFLFNSLFIGSLALPAWLHVQYRTIKR
jgi:hypothetical protein